ncbi:hypothetical protein [Halopiger goleimassiliensis]|uniref:hypothetical protein n=1 Tax=Halopiger goleimassiliensis TaxID=1293048 RepID=UPI000677C06D|nr:hypothetical protein [Halopiger goleimassiliensis]
MIVQPLPRGQPVELEFAGRRLEGTVADVRWDPSWANPRTEIVVDADGARITVGRGSVTPR